MDEPETDLAAATNHLAPDAGEEPGTARARTALGNLPDALRRRFLAEPARHGRYLDYFTSPSAVRPAFRDRGGSLTTTTNDPATLAALVAIAEHRGWRTLRVRGDDDFRREIWRLGASSGLEVQGYAPKARDREALARDVQARTAAAARPPTADALARGVIGVVTEIGRAPFQDRRDQPPSPFVRLARDEGGEAQLWGAGLPGALTKAGAKVGDRVRLQKTSPAEDRGDAPAGRGRRRAAWTAEVVKAAEPARGDRVDPIVQARLSVVAAVARALLPDPAAVDRVVAAAQARIDRHLAAGRRLSGLAAEPAPETERGGSRSRGPERSRR